MNISSVGASSIQALLLQSTSSSVTNAITTDDLSVLAGSSADTLAISAQAQWMQRSQGQDPFRADFENLGKLINAGDLDGAKKAFSEMQDKMKAHEGQGASASGNPMADGFAAVAKALASGDTSAAQDAWKNLDSQMQTLASQHAGGHHPHRGGGLKEDMDKLGQLLESGDLTGAKSLLQTMQDRMKQGPGAAGASSSQTGTSGSTLASGFEALGKALDSGDATAAKSAWTDLQSQLEAQRESMRSAMSAQSQDPMFQMMALGAYQAQMS